MKPKRSSKAKRFDPVEKRRDWLYLSGFARMRVWNSGGPIHAPHERVLQLLIRAWADDHESWTVYRHETDPNKDGKVVFKRWDYEADRERFLALGQKQVRRAWHTKTNVSERQSPVPARWVRELERVVGALSVPPIAGGIQPLSRDTQYQLSFWRNRQESEFSWHRIPPKAWRPLARLFSGLLRNFRQHAKGGQLAPIDKL
jgi:hypothetical protein